MLSHNHPLSAEAYASIRTGLDAIGRLHGRFRAYVDEHGLNPEVFLPGGAWYQLYEFDAFERWTYDLVNNVRCLAPLFTGFDMLAWERRDGPAIDLGRAQAFHANVLATGTLPPDIDAVLEKVFMQTTRLERSHYLAEVHAELTQNVPAKYIARCPDRMGEIGIIHDERIINPDLITYQSRINAIIGGGVFDVIDRAIERRGRAAVLEIGPGLCFIPYSLHQMFGGRLQIVLIDLPRMMAFGYAYLAGLVGAEHVAVIAAPGEPWPDAPFVFVPNYLVPAYARALPRVDVAYNALSLNEMHPRQIDFYLDLIEAQIDPDGVFFLEQGAKYLDSHEDAMAAAGRRFPNHRTCWDTAVGGLRVLASPNSYFYATAQGAAVQARRTLVDTR
jgi:hypothetical protein